MRRNSSSAIFVKLGESLVNALNLLLSEGGLVCEGVEVVLSQYWVISHLYFNNQRSLFAYPVFLASSCNDSSTVCNFFFTKECFVLAGLGMREIHS